MPELTLNLTLDSPDLTHERPSVKQQRQIDIEQGTANLSSISERIEQRVGNYLDCFSDEEQSVLKSELAMACYKSAGTLPVSRVHYSEETDILHAEVNMVLDVDIKAADVLSKYESLQYPAEAKLAELLAMNDAEFSKAIQEMTQQEWSRFSLALTPEQTEELQRHLTQALADSAISLLIEAEAGKEALKEIKPFNGYCGENNPYEYGSVEYWVQEWVGNSETLSEAFITAKDGKMDKTVPKEFHDNMTAAEHYIFVKGLLDESPSHSSGIAQSYTYNAFGFLSGGYSLLKSVGFFDSASPASFTQAEWETRGWSDKMNERLLSLFTGNKEEMVTSLGECIMNSDYYKRMNLDE